MLSLSARLVSTTTLRVSRIAPNSSLLPRAFLSSHQSRHFLTSARLQLAATTDGKPTKSKSTAKGTKPKSAAKKNPAAKKSAQKKTPTKRVAAKKPKKPTFDRTLMTPPKRPSSPYFIFNTERFRAANIKNLDEAKVVAKETSDLWKSMSDGEKQVYSEKSVLARAEYLKAYEEWYKSLPRGYFLEINKRRVAKGKSRLHRPTTLPKSPSPPWTAFMKEYRAKRGITGRFTESLPEIHSAWKSLPEDEKAVYYKRYKDAREEWVKQVQA
ncbi:hypothetical protein VKT23_020078 [Stygiomarasmius scandens]|uniref:HMG box domain-containing protein n=1 Tax=Marasmiellus scandens TaxID=2682957 RepID=A0ABR1INR6_9AGAR